jgi:hypothetical protein
MHRRRIFPVAAEKQIGLQKHSFPGGGSCFFENAVKKCVQTFLQLIFPVTPGADVVDKRAH